MEKEKKDNNGCAIVGIVLFFLAIWGFMGMMDGHSFMDGIGNSIKALVILIVVGLAIFGFIKLNE